MDSEQLIRDIVNNVMAKLEDSSLKDTNSTSSQELPVAKSSQTSAAVSINGDRDIVCGVSVRHIHLSREHADILFGKGYELQVLKELYQPGTYAYKETVTIVGPKLSALQRVRILGPLRDKTQVELAKTDCISLGVDAPVRPSGSLEGSSSAVIIGPKGAVYLNEGVIRANRHIHLSEEDAKYFGVKDNQEVDVRVSGSKGLTFNNVQVRVSPNFIAEMHVDTDDANAADIVNGTKVEIVDASCIVSDHKEIADANHTPPEIPDESFSGEIADRNILKSMNTVLSEKVSSAVNEDDAAKPKKTVITVEDLDDYKQKGIDLSDNVILSPLARDEAKKRGIKII